MPSEIYNFSLPISLWILFLFSTAVLFFVIFVNLWMLDRQALLSLSSGLMLHKINQETV